MPTVIIAAKNGHDASLRRLEARLDAAFERWRKANPKWNGVRITIERKYGIWPTRSMMALPPEERFETAKTIATVLVRRYNKKNHRLFIKVLSRDETIGSATDEPSKLMGRVVAKGRALKALGAWGKKKKKGQARKEK